MILMKYCTDFFKKEVYTNIQTLANEMYKSLHGLSPTIMGDILKLNSHAACNVRRNLRKRPALQRRQNFPSKISKCEQVLSFL